MNPTNQTAVVAVGGNALITDLEHAGLPDQAVTAEITAKYLADMIEAGWKVVITHGNGPQVGFIMRRSDIGMHEVPPIPMDYATSNTQGSIGYMFQRALRNEFNERGIKREVVSLITQTLVDFKDPAFKNPTKPIGAHLDEATARQREEEQGWVVKEDAGRGWRRVVPSPLPKGIIELDVIKDLAARGVVVIAGGGGGIPVYYLESGKLHGVEAVIDKDFASSLLALEMKVDLFLISTAVEKVAINFNKPDEQWLDRMTLSEAKAYAAEGHFAAGSMGPKVQAMIEFLEGGGKEGLITDPKNIGRALAGETGTRVVRD